MSNTQLAIALASRINFEEALWEFSPYSVYNDIAVEADRLANLAAAMPITDLHVFHHKVVFPYGSRISDFLQQQPHDATALSTMAEELGKLAFAFCPAAHAAILKFTGYDAPRHHVEPDEEGFAIVSPGEQHLVVVLADSQDSHAAARDLANKICTFLDTQP